MNKTDIESMATEEFTNESEMKYGEIECSICLINFETGDIMRVMKCGHRFHKACVDEWLSRYKSVCPLCKIDRRGNVASCEEVDANAPDVEMGDVTSDNHVDNDHASASEHTE